MRRHRFDPWVRKIPWRRKWQPSAVFSPGESHGRRSLAGLQSTRSQASDLTQRVNNNSGKAAFPPKVLESSDLTQVVVYTNSGLIRCSSPAAGWRRVQSDEAPDAPEVGPWIRWGQRANNVSAHSVLLQSLQPHRLQPTRLLRPWDFPGKNTALGGCALLHGDLSDPGIEPRTPASLARQAGWLPLSHLASLSEQCPWRQTAGRRLEWVFPGWNSPSS